MADKNETCSTQFSVLSEITVLRCKSRLQISARYEELFGKTPAANLTTPFIIKRILWRLQEIRYGGITRKAEELLDRIADTDKLANLDPDCPKNGKPPKAGGRQIKKEWHGTTYIVTVDDDGIYFYNGRPYKSLSAVAKEITGTHWNGKTFFGIK